MLNEFAKIAMGASLTLPALEVCVFLVALTLCLVFRFSRAGLVIAYLFSYRWGWILFVGQSQKFLFAYLLFGSIVGILTVIGLMYPSTPDE